jgi:uncharacterized protein
MIPFKGLDLGDHHYDFVVGDSFFESYTLLNIRKGALKLTVDLEKESGLMVFDFHFSGVVMLQCDRCLEEYSQDLAGDYRLVVKFAEKFEEISDELITIPHDENRFDLSQYIYEYVNLMLPIKRVHPDDENGNSTCNREMLDRIDNYKASSGDPRWDALKKLKTNK